MRTLSEVLGDAGDAFRDVASAAASALCASSAAVFYSVNSASATSAAASSRAVALFSASPTSSHRADRLGRRHQVGHVACRAVRRDPLGRLQEWWRRAAPAIPAASADIDGGGSVRAMRSRRPAPRGRAPVTTQHSVDALSRCGGWRDAVGARRAVCAPPLAAAAVAERAARDSSPIGHTVDGPNVGFVSRMLRGVVDVRTAGAGAMCALPRRWAVQNKLENLNRCVGNAYVTHVTIEASFNTMGSDDLLKFWER